MALVYRRARTPAQQLADRCATHKGRRPMPSGQHLSMKTNEAVQEMAMDAVEASIDNKELQEQFQREILAACQAPPRPISP